MGGGFRMGLGLEGKKVRNRERRRFTGTVWKDESSYIPLEIRVTKWTCVIIHTFIS